MSRDDDCVFSRSIQVLSNIEDDDERERLLYEVYPFKSKWVEELIYLANLIQCLWLMIVQ